MIDPSKIPPSMRALVAWLEVRAFWPTACSDGLSEAIDDALAGQEGEASVRPYVTMRCPPKQGILEAQRLERLIRKQLQVVGASYHVQFTYDPDTDTGSLTLYGVTGAAVGG
jgi:hypothetical protein